VEFKVGLVGKGLEAVKGEALEVHGAFGTWVLNRDDIASE
jgi:hypothetical protein